MDIESKFAQTSDSTATVAGVGTAARSFQSDRVKNQRMVTGRIDQISSFLMALIVFIGSAVAMMFLAWMLTPSQSAPPEQTPAVSRVTFGSAGGFDLDFEEPSPAEVVVLKEPTLEELVQQIADLPSDTPASSGAPTSAASDGASGSGKKSGREAGPDQLPGDDGVNVIPPYERWELKFTAGSEKEFAAQLAALKIELGAFGGGQKGVDIAAAPFDQSASRHNADATTEDRLYFSWNRPTPLQSYERSLIERAGIVSTGRQIVKFVSPELEKSLAMKELEYARKHGVDAVSAIASTVFDCRANDGGYDFVVIDQRYRK